MNAKQNALCTIDKEAPLFRNLSDAIWDNPETCYLEKKSAALQIQALRELGFTVEENLAGIPTAFSGRFGSGKPVIGLLGEFDALSGLSQKADVAVQEPITPGAPGHGCGHNLLGTAAIAAAAAVKSYLEAGHPGTVIYYGCPAEEGGSGKAFMARDGVFDELDCALTWHPGDTNVTPICSSLANCQISYHFKGIAAHAAGAPHLGRSALDAVELMNVGVQFLREHIIPEARVHYAITNSGGYSPNVVQPTADVLYLIRAPKTPQVQEIYERVNNIARGAALMTDTQVEITFIKACSNIVPNTVLSELMQKNMEELGAPSYTEPEVEAAYAIAATYADRAESPEGILRNLSPADAKATRAKLNGPIYDCVIPLAQRETVMPGSSDVGDVSWVCPTAQISAVTQAAGTPGHSWQLVAQGKSSIAHKGMLFAAKVMAASAIDLLEDPAAVQQARDELADRLDHKPFVSPIPKDVIPQAIGMKQ